MLFRSVRRLCGADESLSIRAPSGLCAELTQQPGWRLLHLVNYRPDEPANDIEVSVRIPASRSVASVVLVSPQAAEDTRLPFEVGDGSVKFTVPRVGIYAIAVMTMK